MTGADTILASYRESDEVARREFDFIRYQIEAVATESSEIQLTFFDDLRHGSSAHTFRCRQIVYFDEKLKIERIDIVEIPGERERLNEFCDVCGASLR